MSFNNFTLISKILRPTTVFCTVLIVFFSRFNDERRGKVYFFEPFQSWNSVVSDSNLFGNILMRRSNMRSIYSAVDVMKVRRNESQREGKYVDGFYIGTF